MIPAKLPTLTSKDFLDPPSEEFEVGNQRSTIGWLMYFFLLKTEGEFLTYGDADRKDYNKAISLFKRVNSVGRHTDLLDWEDETKLSTQKKAFNKFSRVFNLKGLTASDSTVE